MSSYCLVVYGEKSTVNLIEDFLYMNLSLLFLLYRSFLYLWVLTKEKIDNNVGRSWSLSLQSLELDSFWPLFLQIHFSAFSQSVLLLVFPLCICWSIIWYPTSLSNFVHFSSFFSLSVLWFYYFNCPYLQLILSPICSNLMLIASSEFFFQLFHFLAPEFLFI